MIREILSIRRHFSLILAALLIVILAPYVSAHENHKHASKSEGYKLSKINYTIPHVALADTEGKKRELSAALNRTPVLMNFIFTSCTAICPTLSATFSQVQKQLAEKKENVNIVSISIDPEYDTPEKLKEYAEKFNTGSNWNFYTGRNKDIVKVQRSFDAYRGSKMNHIPLTYIRANANAPWIRIEGFTSAKNIVDEFHKAIQSKNISN